MLYYHRYIFMSRFLYKDNIKYNDLNFYFIKFDCLKMHIPRLERISIFHTIIISNN